VTPQPGDPEVIFRADELGPLNLQPRPRRASGRRLGRNAKLAHGAGHCFTPGFPDNDGRRAARGLQYKIT